MVAELWCTRLTGNLGNMSVNRIRVLRSLRSRFRRVLYFLPKLPPGLLESAFYLAAPHFWPSEIKKGIRIFDPNPETFPHSVKALNEALELIEQNDPRRFKRVKNEIRSIVQMPVAESGSYSRLTRACTIDLRHFPLTETPKFALVLLAGLIVHEATHGHLFSKGIMHTKKVFQRTETACWKEEVRFALKLGFDFREFLPSEHNLNNPELLERFKYMSEKMEAKIILPECRHWWSFQRHPPNSKFSAQAAAVLKPSIRSQQRWRIILPQSQPQRQCRALVQWSNPSRKASWFPRV